MSTKEDVGCVILASLFEEHDPEFLWKPYLPIGEFCVLMAAGGTGKTVLACGIAAAISAGTLLPGETERREPQKILFISAEDTGGELRRRLRLSGADLDRCFVVDAEHSGSIDLAADFEGFEDYLETVQPALVIVDPWHAFLGEKVDVGKINAVRPIFHRLANACKKNNCSTILISHINKRAQGENANNAALGSVDLINASRSTLQTIFDEADRECRILVHTKSNFAALGDSLRYRIKNGGIEWAGTSDITRETLEEAARKRTTPGEIKNRFERDWSGDLFQAVKAAAGEGQPKKYTYGRFKELYGADIFGMIQPKRALDDIAGQLREEGISVRSGIRVFYNGAQDHGFSVAKISPIIQNTMFSD